MKKITLPLLSFCVATLVNAATPEDLATEVIKANPVKGAAKVEATEVSETRYTYFIWYRQGEGSVAKARTDTQRLIRATLTALVKQGVKPTEDWKFIHAHGAEVVPGETRTMASELGDAMYNFNTDQIEFKPPKR